MNGKPGKAKQIFRIIVNFSHHCFTVGIDEGGAAPSAEESYSDASRNGMDPRKFCPARWALSKRLPAIMRGIATRDCYETNKYNYLTVEIGAGIAKEDYIVYFRTDRWRQGDGSSGGSSTVGMKLTVESAYLRSDAPQRHSKPVSFNVIASRLL